MDDVTVVPRTAAEVLRSAADAYEDSMLELDSFIIQRASHDVYVGRLMVPGEEDYVPVHLAFVAGGGE